MHRSYSRVGDTLRRTSIGRLTKVFAGMVAVAAVATTFAATASARVSPELYFQVKGSAVTEALPGQGSGGVSVWRASLGGEKISIQCGKTRGAFMVTAVGKSSNIAYYEECKFTEPATLAAKCTVVPFEMVSNAILAYEAKSEKMVEVLKAPAGSTTLTELVVEGAECVLAGKHPIKGVGIAKVSPESKEASTSTVSFAINGSGEQVPKAYGEQPNETGYAGGMTFSGEPFTLVSSETLELDGKEAWGVF